MAYTITLLCGYTYLPVKQTPQFIEYNDPRYPLQKELSPQVLSRFNVIIKYIQQHPQLKDLVPTNKTKGKISFPNKEMQTAARNLLESQESSLSDGMVVDNLLAAAPKPTPEKPALPLQEHLLTPPPEKQACCCLIM